MYIVYRYNPLPSLRPSPLNDVRYGAAIRFIGENARSRIHWRNYERHTHTVRVEGASVSQSTWSIKYWRRSASNVSFYNLKFSATDSTIISCSSYVSCSYSWTSSGHCVWSRIRAQLCQVCIPAIKQTVFDCLPRFRVKQHCRVGHVLYTKPRSILSSVF